MLLTPNFLSDGLKCRTIGDDDVSISVPIVPWLRCQLDTVEKYVKENVSIPSNSRIENASPKYKPLWPCETMFVNVSRWCTVFVRNAETNTVKSVSLKDANFGYGSYSITIDVAYIYIGPHKMGEDFSLTLRVVQIAYEPLTKPANISMPSTVINESILPQNNGHERTEEEKQEK